jgi:hypothetical protein
MEVSNLGLHRYVTTWEENKTIFENVYYKKILSIMKLRLERIKTWTLGVTFEINSLRGLYRRRMQTYS